MLSQRCRKPLPCLAGSPSAQPAGRWVTSELKLKMVSSHLSQSFPRLLLHPTRNPRTASAVCNSLQLPSISSKAPPSNVFSSTLEPSSPCTYSVFCCSLKGCLCGRCAAGWTVRGRLQSLAESIAAVPSRRAWERNQNHHRIATKILLQPRVPTCYLLPLGAFSSTHLRIARLPSTSRNSLIAKRPYEEEQPVLL